MAKERNVFFPQYLKRPRILYLWEIDIVIMFILGFVGGAVLATFMGLPSFFIFILAFVFSFLSSKVYGAVKNNSAPGYLNHLMYTLGVRNPIGKKRAMEDPEIMALGGSLLIPSGKVTEFMG